MSTRKGLIALSPLAVFLLVYLVTSLIIKDFYAVPVTSAFLVASIYAVLTTGGLKLSERIEIFSTGAGNSNVLMMIWIFILAGAFAQTAKDIGAVDATVGLTLSIIPPKMLFAGLFLTSCFISMAMGTSVGTIVALVPIAAGIASETGSSVAFMTAIIVGGSFFGDNLSFISDTTIAATRAMDCSMSDKFRVNLFIVAPAVIAVLAIYIAMGAGTQAVIPSEPVQWLKLLPYLMVIVLAVLGLNVLLVLTMGIALNFILGISDASLNWVSWLSSMGEGIAGMGSLIVVTMLSGGMMELIRYNGGLSFLIEKLAGSLDQKQSATAGKGLKRRAELCIAALVSLANLCTANNTIAILTTGGIAKDVADRFCLDRKKVASILDTFSCLIQGLIPYGAQLLMASGLAGVDSAHIISYLYYPFILGIVAILAILFRYPRRYSR